MATGTAPVNGIDIAYETFGDPSNPTLLLIMGLGAQMVAWDDDFCHAFVERGYHVVRFDNRDVGLTTKLDDKKPDVIAAMSGDTSSAAYTIDDMADDAAGLLDRLGIDKAHICGASMGGMIAQAFAIRFPERTLTLTSIMSTTGDRSVGGATPEATQQLLRPPATTEDEAVEAAVAVTKVIGSKGLPIDWDRVKRKAALAYQRCYYPEGRARQLVGIMASPDRTPQLRQLRVPTLVIHGTDDVLVLPTGGQATADAIPGAELLMVEGMGHDLPPAAWPQIIEAMTALFQRASATETQPA